MSLNLGDHPAIATDQYFCHDQLTKVKKFKCLIHSPRAEFDSIFSELICICGQWQPGRR